MSLDWGDGSYETTAAQLAPVAEHVVQRAQITSGQRVLDLGCGTGNAALLAARLGASVTGIDPSQRLREAAQRRLADQGFRIDVRPGIGSAIDADAASFDVVVAVFSVIFDPEPAKAAQEMLRVTRPGGCIALSSWVPAGALLELASLLYEEPPPPSPWSSPETIQALFPGHSVHVQERTLPIESESPEAFFDALETEHPFWRSAKTQSPETWPALRTRAVAIAERANEVEDGFRVTSRYLLTRIDVPER